MGLDIWFSEDIRNALLAANEASSATAVVVAEVISCGHTLPRTAAITCSVCGEREYYVSATELLAVYREGYKVALCTLALAFGLSPAAVVDAGREVRETGGRLASGFSP